MNPHDIWPSGQDSCWSEVFLDPTAAAAVIDRIIHHSRVFQTTGSSYRLAAAKRNQAATADEKEQTR